MSANFSPDYHGWIHEIARAESLPESDIRGRLLQTSGSPQQAVEESTVNYLTDLRADFQEYVRVFNSLSEAGKKFAEIKLFNLTNGAADFMLYRNGIRLVIANTAHGVIQISFNQHSVPGSGTVAQTDIPGGEEILAQLGIFGTVHWVCRGEKIDSEEVSKYVFGEFVRLTRDNQWGKSTNQKALLDQIKALLQEQGIRLK